MRKIKPSIMLLSVIILLILLPSCKNVAGQGPELNLPKPQVHQGDNDVHTAFPTDTPQPTLAPTPDPIIVEALVWEENPQIPILNFHNFTHRQTDEETGTIMYLSNFKSIIERLYNAGYSLISMRDYLDGKIVVPEGRKPLLLSLDDAYFANQLSLKDDGSPSELSGIGWLYKFSQEHPDFGFEVSMFTNFGDKLYANDFWGNWWYLGDNWEEDFAKTIVWGIEHHIIPLNHLYQHPDLEKISELEILYQAEKNDETLRYYLEMVNRSELLDQVANVIALPYGKWPQHNTGKETLLSYSNPEGKPLEAVFEAGYEYDPKMSLSPLDADFDPYHIPRMAPINKIVRFVVDSAPNLPVAKTCKLSLPHDANAKDIQTLVKAIEWAIQNNTCSEGFFIIGETIFEARNGQVLPWQAPHQQAPKP